MIFDLAEFWDGLGVVQADFYLPDRRSMQENGSGSVQPIQIGQRTWVGDVSIRRYPHVEARLIKAKIEAMKEADGVFYLSPSDRRDIPDVPSDHTTTIANIHSDRRRIEFAGSVQIQPGDYVGINKGGVYSLHSLVRSNTDDFGAVAPYLTVVPPVPLGISMSGAAPTATIFRPQIKARLSSGSRGPAFSAVLSDTFSFSFHQVLS